jgi:hypothetical protein
LSSANELKTNNTGIINVAMLFITVTEVPDDIRQDQQKYLSKKNSKRGDSKETNVTKYLFKALIMYRRFYHNFGDISLSVVM